MSVTEQVNTRFLRIDFEMQIVLSCEVSDGCDTCLRWLDVELEKRAFQMIAIIIDDEFDLVDVLSSGKEEVQTVDRNGLYVASVRVDNGDRVEQHLDSLLSPEIES